jgi:sulfite exporter TauE/SafE
MILVAFAVGLLSALHCIGMCGGLMGALSVALPEGVRGRPGRLLAFLTVYNLGRILSYTLAGALAGGVGRTLVSGSGSVEVGLILRVAAALLMVLAGLNLAGWLPAVGRLERLGAPLWRRLEPYARRLLPVRTPARAVLYGAVWGWLPCGLVYTMLGVAAGQATVAGGAATMAAFGAGTLPTLLLTGAFAGRLSRLRRGPRLRQLAGLAVAGIGVATLIYTIIGDIGITPHLDGGRLP